MNIDDLIKEIIPPATYHYRNGFSNEDIIDSLSQDEKSLVEDRLLQMLWKQPKDFFILDTLTYMMSESAIPIAEDLFYGKTTISEKLYLANILFSLTKNEQWTKKGLALFKQIKGKYNILSALYSLFVFGTQEAKDILESYVNHKDVLLQSNAKRFLKMLKDKNKTPA